jgi:site-specific recombinase XerD
MLPEIERFQHWLRRKAPNASTHIHYTSDLKLFFDWLDKPVIEVQVADVDTFIEQCLQESLAFSTINRRLAALRSFFRFLMIESESYTKNPVIPRRHFIQLGQQLPRDIQDPVVARLFQAITGPRDRSMFLLMLRCGLRVGEVRNLSMNDLYLEPAFGSLPRLWLRGKGGKQRVAYLSSQPLAALQVWLAVRSQDGDEAVFLNRFGKRLTVTGIQSRLMKYCRVAGVWVTCHQLRHTFGRHLTEARVPVTTIQKLLGHSWLETTQIYLHISDSQAQDDYEAAMQMVTLELSCQGNQP